MDNDLAPRQPSIADALLPIGTLIVLLVLSLLLFGDNASYGPNQIALILSAGVAALVGWKNGHHWDDIESGIVKGISLSLGAIMILLAVGSLIGTWLLSGTVPTLIYYGLQLISPSWFYPATCLICAIVGTSIGSSWSTAATVGVALMGVAAGLGMDEAITAGAIISGAYFGDKMSPLSETTNMAPAVVGANLFDHIRNMTWTSVPALAVALLVFTTLGLQHSSSTELDTFAALMKGLEQHFEIGAVMLVPMAVLIILSIKKVPAFPSVLIGALTGAIWALIFQADLVASMASDNHTFGAHFAVVWTAMFDGVSIETGNALLDKLISRGGMSSMLNTVWLIICAMAFGAVLEKLGMLELLLQALLNRVHSLGGLISSTVATSISTNLVTAEQYMAIVLPGRMYKDEYEKRGLAPEALSRTLEDAGTITSPLVPWNSCGAYMHSVLMINPLDYAMYAVFNWLCALFAIAYGFLNFKIKRLPQAVVQQRRAARSQAEPEPA
jgi:NhaC family Na+:H+ antiporter